TWTVAWAREHGVLVLSDECYPELGCDAHPVSVVHPDVNSGSNNGIVSVHSLSKRTNTAGYQAALLVGDPALLGPLLQTRNHGAQPGRRRGGPGRRRARPRPARTLRGPPRRPAPGTDRPRLPHRAQRGGPVPVGHPGRVLLGHGRPPRRPRRPGGAGRLLRPRRRGVRPRRRHRHGRAGARGGGPPDGVARPARVRCVRWERPTGPGRTPRARRRVRPPVSRAAGPAPGGSWPTAARAR